MSQRQTAVGTAPNVDMSTVDPTTPFERDVDSYRSIECYCMHCRLTEIVLAEPGRQDEWTHAVDHPDHSVDYHLEASR
jgi:hypothetical protein